jgi:hypothetical protein
MFILIKQAESILEICSNTTSILRPRKEKKWTLKRRLLLVNGTIKQICS